jgi:hypothetical protein
LAGRSSKNTTKCAVLSPKPLGPQGFFMASKFFSFSRTLAQYPWAFPAVFALKRPWILGFLVSNYGKNFFTKCWDSFVFCKLFLYPAFS